MSQTYLVCTIKSWNIENFRKLQSDDQENNWHIITDPVLLTVEKVRSLNPRYIFFPHWSTIIPAEIYENFKCVVFHMTDLPYGRGGSPLQNLIVRGHRNTRISAIQAVKEMDAGPVYMKRDLSLEGHANEILRRASGIVYEMIKEIISTECKPIPQTGQVVKFKRRKQKDGNIGALTNLKNVYGYIRMLDGEGYPSAWVETEQLYFEFIEAELKEDGVHARVIITKKK